MPNESLGCPSSPRSLVYDQVVTMLRDNPWLKKSIATWKTYQGDEDDAQPFAEGDVPGLEILPQGMAAYPISTTSQGSPFGIRITLVTESLDVRNLMDLWEQVEATFFTGAGTGKTLATFQAITPNVYSIVLQQPAFTPNPEGFQHSVMQASGVIVFNMRTNK